MPISELNLTQVDEEIIAFIGGYAAKPANDNGETYSDAVRERLRRTQMSLQVTEQEARHELSEEIRNDDTDDIYPSTSDLAARLLESDMAIGEQTDIFQRHLTQSVRLSEALRMHIPDHLEIGPAVEQNVLDDQTALGQMRILSARRNAALHRATRSR